MMLFRNWLIWVLSLPSLVLSTADDLKTRDESETCDDRGLESAEGGHSLLQRRSVSQMVPGRPDEDPLAVERCYESVQDHFKPSLAINQSSHISQEHVKAMLGACTNPSGRILDRTLTSTEVVKPQQKWAVISSTTACEINEEKIERMAIGSASDGVKYTLNECKAKCLATAGCAAIDYYRETEWCNLYDTACTTPGWGTYRASSYKLTGFDCKNGSDSECKTCQPLSERGAKNHCASCNDGYFLANNTCLRHDVTCTSGVVWILVNSGDEPIPAHIVEKMPSEICLQTLVRNGGRTFWEGRTKTILSYLNTQPEITFVIMTDTDVLVNALTWEEIQDRYQQLTTPTARVVVSMEQTCWFGHPCALEEANEWLNAVRGNSSGIDDLNFFPNSQYMGEVEAVTAMLNRGLEVNPYDDQAALGTMIKENASVFALDYKELIFVSMSRGVAANPKGSWTCNWGGDNSTPCDITTQSQWGSCEYNEGYVTLTGGSSALAAGETLRPLVMHVNGLAPWSMSKGLNCGEIFRNASNGAL